MLTIDISLNGKTVFARSAHRRTKRFSKGKKSAYLTDSGETIYHDPNKGILLLAIKVIATILEV